MRCERSIGGACVSSSRIWPCREAQGKGQGGLGKHSMFKAAGVEELYGQMNSNVSS